MSAYLQQMSSVDYFNKLQERVGHHRNDDPKELTTDDLVTLGRALAEEHRFITGGMNASGKMEQVLMQIMAFQNDHPSLETPDRASEGPRHQGSNHRLWSSERPTG